MRVVRPRTQLLRVGDPLEKGSCGLVASLGRLAEVHRADHVGAVDAPDQLNARLHALPVRTV